MTRPPAIVAGSASRDLCARIAAELGVAPAETTVDRHPDSEVHVVLREPVRRRDVIVVQSTAPPVDTRLIELLALVDACRRAAAGRIIAVVPYFGYGRGDRRGGLRGPVMASLVARLLEAAGIDHLVTVDLHAPQTEGFFQVPVDSLTAVPVLTSMLADTIDRATVVVSPDLGRIGMATDVAATLGLDTAVIEKRRHDGATTSERGLIGDVRGRPCLIVDDILATGETVVHAMRLLRDAGALPDMTLAVSHGLFVGDAVQRLADERIGLLVTTDTVAAAGDAAPFEARVGSTAAILASAVRRLVA